MIYFQLFWRFFLVGCFSFGGGYPMLTLIEKQILHQGWITSEQFAEVISISGMLPGSIGTNAAAFIGYQTAGGAGALVAMIGITAPSLIMVLLVGKFFNRFQENQLVGHILYGLRPVVVGLIFYAAINFGISLNIVTTMSVDSVYFIGITMAALYLLERQKMNPLLIILLSAIAGISVL